MATKAVEPVKLTTLQKKSNAIVSAQASALTAAIKTADDVAAIAANPSKFAKANGIELTASFASELKASIANAELSNTLQLQLSEAAASKLLVTIGKVIEGSGVETDCAHILVKKKRILWTPVLTKKMNLPNCVKTVDPNIRIATAKKIVK